MCPMKWKDTLLFMTWWFHTSLQNAVDVVFPSCGVSRQSGPRRHLNRRDSSHGFPPSPSCPRDKHKQHEPTRWLVASGKNNSDSNWYKYVSFCSCPLPPHRRLSFGCLFSFRNPPPPALPCKGCLCLRWSDRRAQLSVKCWDPGSRPAL